MSPAMWKSNVAYAVPAAKREASIELTQGAGGRPRTFRTTLSQCLPPSRVSCRFPSEVPAQISSAFFGDSETE